MKNGKFSIQPISEPAILSFKISSIYLSVQSINCLYDPCGKLLRSLGSCAELLLLHFSSFTIGRRLEVTVGSEEESMLKPTVLYSASDVYPLSPVPAHVITVSAPKGTPRYQKTVMKYSDLSGLRQIYSVVPGSKPSKVKRLFIFIFSTCGTSFLNT